MNKKIGLEHIQILGELIRQEFSIEESVLLLEKIYGLELKEIMIDLQGGKELKEVIASLYPSSLFKELILFYGEYKSMDECIQCTIELMERIKGFKEKIIHILLYPAILLVSVIFFSLFILIYLKPKFFAFYESFEIKLSLLNLILLNVLFYLPFVILLILILFIILLIRILYSFKRDDLEAIEKYLTYPFIGNILRIYISMKFDLYYKEFVKNEISLNIIISFFKTKVEDKLIQMISFHLEEAIEKGIMLDSMIENSIYFETMFKSVYILSLSYDKKGDLFDTYFSLRLDFVEKRIELFRQVITPLIYLFVAVYIVGIYVLMIIPMTNMISNL